MVTLNVKFAVKDENSRDTETFTGIVSPAAYPSFELTYRCHSV